jgi:phosphohistidine phosphatase
MKTLMLMRHAKSSWKDSSMKDILRPLNKRGHKIVPRMGERLKEAQICPQLILSSPAERARQTAQGVAKKIDYSQDIQYYDSFYMGEPEDYIKKLVKVPDTVERVLVIGHNPGLEGLMQILSRKVEALPTAAIAFISLPIEHWKDLDSHIEGALNEIWRPKNLDSKS